MIQSILDTLWPADLPSKTKVMAVLDGAQDDVIYAMLSDAFQEHFCLYGGNLPWPLPQTAPYLVELERDDRLTRFILEKGRGQNWGFFLRTNSSAKAMRHHLRHFLMARDEKGRRLIFRFYDPRVLRAYLPTCTEAELRAFLGPAEEFFVESPDGLGLTRYSLGTGGRLQVQLCGGTLREAASKPAGSAA